LTRPPASRAAIRRVTTIVASVLLHAIAASAQPSVGAGGALTDIDAVRASKRALAVRIDQPIQLDGVLDDEAWRHADPATDFYQQQPSEFELATFRTEVRFVYDGTTLYVGAMMYDAQPERVIVNDLKRDFNGRDTDMFGLVLDTFRDQRSAYGFLANPGGAQRDTQAYENGRRNDPNWHAAWTARTAVLADGWSVEYAIPFRALRFPDVEAQEWGLNLVRIVRRDNEISTWSPVPRQFSHYQVAYAGALSGISGVSSGRNLQVKPALTASVDKQTDRRGGGSPWSGDGDAGLDVKWGLTPSLVLDATLRTDFSQVEADEQQINLTRFSLFFPEKREFFLESPASFQIGLAARPEDDRRDIVPFFSRRIGLSDDGRPIPVLGGLRLTGRMGHQTIGALAMRTGDAEERPGDTFTAVRVGRDVMETATIGAFYFGREAQGSADFNRVAGAELRFAPRRTVEMEAFAMRSATSGAPGDWAGRAGFTVETSAHRAFLSFIGVGDAFRHDLGFVRRVGINTLVGRYARVFRHGLGGRVRDYQIGAEAEATTDASRRRMLTGVGVLDGAITFTDGSVFEAWTNGTYERLRKEAHIGGLPIEPGRYDFVDGGVSFESDKSAAVSGGVVLQAGEFWSGTQRLASGSLRVRLNAHVAASGTFSRSRIEFPSGTFVGNLVGIRLDWSFTPRMFLNAFVQYNGEDDAWITNVRYNFMHRPLSDIYLVWNETRMSGMSSRALLLKYTHQVGF
jgi:hypothetical protein